jgi:hypothetical protein
MSKRKSRDDDLADMMVEEIVRGTEDFIRNPPVYIVIRHAGKWWAAFEGQPRQLLVECDTEKAAWAAVREMKQGDDECLARVTGKRRYQG